MGNKHEAPMKSDHERLHTMVVEQEQETARNPEKDDANCGDTEQMDTERSSPSPTASDSEQAQDNLERMLETGEENPIS
jgi:hypothetical protein